MKKITLDMDFGRSICGELVDETDQYYQVKVDSTTVPDALEKFRKKADWKKGDLIKVSKSLVKNKK